MKLKLIILSLLLLASGLFLKPAPTLAAPVAVDELTKAKQYQQEDAFEENSGLNFDLSPGQVVGTIVKTVLGLLAIIFIVLLVYAGFQWMTAEGNEERVTKAKDTIVRAIIGLAIVIAAYSITYFVFQNLNKAAGESGGTVSGGMH